MKRSLSIEICSDKTLPRQVQVANTGSVLCLDTLSQLYTDEVKIYVRILKFAIEEIKI